MRQLRYSLWKTQKVTLTTSVLLGLMTHHYVGSNLPYCNTINNWGTIQNSYVVVMTGNDNVRGGLIAGKDSACGDIVGPIGAVSVTKSMQVVVGAYNTNTKKFTDRGIQAPSVGGMTPVLGLDYSIPLTKRVFFDTIVSLGVITHAIRVTF